METATKPERLERSKCATPRCGTLVALGQVYCFRCLLRQRQAGHPEGK